MLTRMGFIRSFLVIVGCLQVTHGKIHSLTVTNDERPVIVLSDFGFLQGGYLKVNITNLKVSQPNQPSIGFSFDKASSTGSSSYVKTNINLFASHTFAEMHEEREENTRGCILDENLDDGQFEDVARAIMSIRPTKVSEYELKIRTRLLKGLKFYSTEEEMRSGVSNPKSSEDKQSESTTAIPVVTTAAAKKEEPIETETPSEPEDTTASPAEDTTASFEDSEETTQSRQKRAAIKDTKKTKTTADDGYQEQETLPIAGNFVDGMNIVFYTQFVTEDQIGLYELYFHNCENPQTYGYNPNSKSVTAAFTAHIVEKNGDSYLSAGDLALPLMYGVMSLTFFAVGVVWTQVICSTREVVFKIHYLMAVIIFVKGLSVMFHSLDYYFIAKDGRSEAWAVIFYIVHLLKGILLFICLLLIGTGWAFIKYILSDRDKKIFMIVIPLQVIANVAYVIMGETEEGNKSYGTWKDVAILVDLLCCGAVLIPVVWSIRHLQEASQTDGKAVINLKKLELFRQFYVMIVCYLYFTRIIVYLLVITLPFRYIWIHGLFQEIGSLVFFSVTGYKFRPGCDNPYLKLDQDDSDDEAEAITRSGAMENLTRVNRKARDEDETDEFDVLLPKQRTTSAV